MKGCAMEYPTWGNRIPNLWYIAHFVVINYHKYGSLYHIKLLFADDMESHNFAVETTDTRKVQTDKATAVGR